MTGPQSSNLVQPGECVHGCRTPMQCLRYDQGGSIPADCILEQRPADAIPNRVENTGITPEWRRNLGNATRNRVRAERVAESVYNRSPIRDKDSERLLEWHELGPLMRETLIEQAQVYIEVTRYV